MPILRKLVLMPQGRYNCATFGEAYSECQRVWSQSERTMWDVLRELFEAVDS